MAWPNFRSTSGVRWRVVASPVSVTAGGAGRAAADCNRFVRFIGTLSRRERAKTAPCMAQRSGSDGGLEWSHRRESGNRRDFVLVPGKRLSKSLLGASPDASAARMVMQRDVKLVHRAVGFVDRLIDRALLIEAARVEPGPASVEKVEHRPDLVPEGGRLS